MSTASLLTSHERCQRREYFERMWERRTLHPTEILRRAIDAGLTHTGPDPAAFAKDEVLRLCVDRGIETESGDLLSIADHTSFLAEMLVWIVRGEGKPWERPDPIGEWNPGCYLSAEEDSLRYLWLTDRWDDARVEVAENSWAIQGECATYSLPMTLIVAVIGQRRDEKWHSPFSTGFQHPVNNMLRFRKRDGEGFGGNWEKVWRERFDGSREDWFNALAADGVLEDHLIIHQVWPSPHQEQIRELVKGKLSTLPQSLPLPQLTQCHLPNSPCPFRQCCPNWLEPSEQMGFLKLPPLPQSHHS
jgi:hypothetical protein